MPIICRKLIASYFSAALIGLGFGFLVAIQYDTEKIETFYGLSVLALFYGGIVMLIYGGISSFLSEMANKRWLQDRTSTFVLSHLLFGVLFGIVFVIAFNDHSMILLGTIGSLFYAVTDRVLDKQKEESKLAFLFLLSPPALFIASILFFLVT